MVGEDQNARIHATQSKGSLEAQIVDKIIHAIISHLLPQEPVKKAFQNLSHSPVHCFAVTLVQDDFRGQILGRATECPGVRSGLQNFGKAKIANLYVALVIKEKIFRLKVSVDDVSAVQILKRYNHLAAKEARRVVGKFAGSAEMGEEFAANRIF